jgi:hypothetical protein
LALKRGGLSRTVPPWDQGRIAERGDRWDRGRRTVIPMPRALRLVVLTLSVAALSACASVDVQSTEYVAAPRYQPTDAKSVQILRTEPKVPHDRLGEVVVDASTDPPPPVVEIEQKLCQAAAKMGANAVVIVLDRVQPVAAYVTGPYWGRSIESVSGRKVIGIAIRFRQ